MSGEVLGYWLMVLGSLAVTAGTLGLIYWRLRVGYEETMDRVERENATTNSTDSTNGEGGD